MTEATPPAATIPTPSRKPTLRAVLLGLALGLALAWVTPWNDWGVRNTMLFGSYLPPSLLVLFLATALFLNPLLGNRRFVPAELATVLALTLAVGGLASVGIMRHLPAGFVEPLRTLADPQRQARWTREATGDELAQRSAESRSLATRIVTAFDRDGDAILGPAERPGLGATLDTADGDRDGNLTAEEIATVVGEHGHQASLIPPGWTLEDAGRGPIAPEETAYTRRVTDYRQGLPAQTSYPRPGSLVRLRAGDGTTRDLLVADGRDRDAALAKGQGVIDSAGHPDVKILLAATPGDPLALSNGTWTIEAITPPGIPWNVWLRTLWRWSPILLALIAGSMALCALVRTQWLHHERLPVPIAAVLSAVIDPRQPSGSGRPPLWSRVFLLGVLVAFAVQALRGMQMYGWLPFAIPMSLDLTESFRGWSAAVDRMPMSWYILRPQLQFTVIAMAFLMTREVSGSIWGSFVAVNLLAGFCNVGGLGITGRDLSFGSVGASAVLALLILWTGRATYVPAVAAAFGLNRTPAAKAAAPWIWLLIGAAAGLIGPLLTAGVGLGIALLVTICFFGSVLVVARVVAETGTPYVSFSGDGRLGGIILGILPAGTAPSVLMPLILIGHMLGLGDRERLLPHLMHGTTIGERHGLGANRLLLLIGGACVLFAVISFTSGVSVGYSLGADSVDVWPANTWGWAISGSTQLSDGGLAAETLRFRTGLDLTIGALVAGIIGVARFIWSWWPLHPVGLIMLTGWVTWVSWASYLVGWGLKGAVMRYGGQALYQRLFPVAVGLMVGEALAVLFFMATAGIHAWLGLDVIRVELLPS